ncbi:Tetraspanin-32 [Galemys pyrenaicus]|uniref:Tetraspanin-32 n=1 Tax=Galemys pyrenaicus TaxID=202257 RepID=A0A8J6AJI8_GALPY|nr:Tetraspanin-32 [Galemys pyrenaicus]
MGPRRRVRAAKCQMLVTSFFVLLLGLSVAAMAALTYFGAHFAVFGRVAWEKAPHKAAHRWAVYSGAVLAGLLTLGALLCAAASVREAGGLMAGGFLCFALGFCGLLQVAFWRHWAPTQLEDAALDAFDLLYEHAVSRSPAAPSRELLAIQDAVSGPPAPAASAVGTRPGACSAGPVLGRGPRHRPRAERPSRGRAGWPRVPSATQGHLDGRRCRAVVVGRAALPTSQGPLAESRRGVGRGVALGVGAACHLAPGPRCRHGLGTRLPLSLQFRCCGKSSPFGRLGGAENHLCPGPEAARQRRAGRRGMGQGLHCQGCLQGIRGVLGTHASIASALTGVGLAVTVPPAPPPAPPAPRAGPGAPLSARPPPLVHPSQLSPRPPRPQVYAMLLSSFLWFAIRAGHGLDRKGKYTPKSR